jgi:hypothetical protein
LEATGGAITKMEAIEVLLVPPSFDVAKTLFNLEPATVPWMLTETEQLAPAASAAPDKLTVLEFATAVAVPPQVFDRTGVAATTRPAGRLSVNATPVRETLVFGFRMEKFRVVVEFRATVVPPKVLVI